MVKAGWALVGLRCSDEELDSIIQSALVKMM